MRSGQVRTIRRMRASALPDAIEFVVLGIRGGHGPVDAVRAAGRFADPCLDEVFIDFEHRLARGAAFADALGAFHDHIGPEAQSFVDGLATADRYGLPLGPVMDRLIDDARHRRRAQTEQAARRLPVALSFPLVVCTLPSFVLLAVVPAVLGALLALRDSLP